MTVVQDVSDLAMPSEFRFDNLVEERLMGFSQKEKRYIVRALRSLRRVKRSKNERVTFQEIEQLIWSLEPSRLDRLHAWFSKFQGK
jgi:hypothetical protein